MTVIQIGKRPGLYGVIQFPSSKPCHSLTLSFSAGTGPGGLEGQGGDCQNSCNEPQEARRPPHKAWNLQSLGG